MIDFTVNNESNQNVVVQFENLKSECWTVSEFGGSTSAQKKINSHPPSFIWWKKPYRTFFDIFGRKDSQVALQEPSWACFFN